MRNKGLWMLLGKNIIIALIFFILMCTLRTNQIYHVYYGFGAIILIEIPIAHLLSKFDEKR